MQNRRPEKAVYLTRSGTGFFQTWPSTTWTEEDEVFAEFNSHEEAAPLVRRLNEVRSFYGTRLDQIDVARLMEKLPQLEEGMK